MRVSPDKTKSAKFADNLITTNDGKWFEVVDDLGNNRYECHPIVTAKMSTRALGLPLPWDKVGVKR